MSKYRNRLPQLNGGLFLTDGGIETTLIFNEGHELPDFAAFHLLKSKDGGKSLRKYFLTYAEIAKRHGTGLILESATWRASSDWGKKLGYSSTELAEANRRSITMLEEIRDKFENSASKVVISGCVGPRGDGYQPEQLMSEKEAEAYHRDQIETFAATSADLVTGITMNYTEEAVGIVRAARKAFLPVVISFTVETDGKLPTGQTLKEAIEYVDRVTSKGPQYYMINCAHPTHFDEALAADEPWVRRIRGIRANASKRSHAELNEAPDLDSGNPSELGEQYAGLRKKMVQLNVLGGCCGTDHRHIDEIGKACSPLF